MRLWGLLVGFVVLLSPSLASAEPQNDEFRFAIGTQNLVMPVPEGFCLPEGADAAAAQITAATDTKNITLGTFVRCNESHAEGMDSYILLKVPAPVLLGQFDKSSALAQFDQLMQSADAPKFDPAMEAEIADGFSKVTGLKPVVKGNFGYLGRNDDCVFLGGRIVFSLPSDEASQASPDPGGLFSTCMTVVQAMLLSVNTYDFRKGARIQAIQSLAHSIAISIRAQ